MAVADEMDMDVSVEYIAIPARKRQKKLMRWLLALKRRRKKLKMTWDFSHPAIIKHLSPPYWDRLKAERPDLIQHANQLHFRPFNGHHAQIPALDRKGNFTPEFVDWLEFAERVLACWLETATPGRELFVCPEQIAGGYFVSVFGDRWKDVPGHSRCN